MNAQDSHWVALKNLAPALLFPLMSLLGRHQRRVLESGTLSMPVDVPNSFLFIRTTRRKRTRLHQIESDVDIL